MEEPAFLPDDVDGRVLFERATARWRALQEGRSIDALPGGFGDIVMVPPVLEARARGVLNSLRPFAKMTREGVIWKDGAPGKFDAVIWCTGFRPALDHLTSLGIAGGASPIVEGTRALGVPGLWLVGYGDWTGVASATLIGVMRSARETAIEIDRFLGA